ncbi:MAG TPA: SPFH domain-containing protein [Gemmataceae bacterium]|nr:SPFH domain-containing protein [Gemmataceae bacterium]
MTNRNILEGDLPAIPPLRNLRRHRWLPAAGLAALAMLILSFVLWHVFFHYVPPGKMLIIISKDGDELRPNQVLADEGQKGIQRKALGEGWHYVTPILYETEEKPNVVIRPGRAGIVTALGGDPPADGRVLAEKETEKGIRREVLLPGSYRLNPYGFKVEEVEAVRVEPGKIGVMRRLLGQDGPDRFAHNPEEKGILREVLQPGTYYLNTKEFEVIPCEVGIYQTSYHYVPDSPKSTAIAFPARDGNTISMDCTIEWEVKPSDWPDLVAAYGDLAVVERNVVDQHARKISRDRGFNFGAQDFLEGEKREKFQSDFTEELKTICKENKVVVHSAFIREMIIPDNFLEQKRERQLAAETRLTSEALTETAEENAKVAEAKRTIEQAAKAVQAETERLVAGIDQETKNIVIQVEADIEALKAKYGAQIAELDAERTRLMGEAEAEVKTMTETAKSSIYKKKMSIFQSDSNAYLRYAMAEKLNDKMVLRMFHSGPGTFWTNLGNKNMNFLLPVPSNAVSSHLGSEPKATTPSK